LPIVFTFKPLGLLPEAEATIKRAKLLLLITPPRGKWGAQQKG